MCDCIKLFYYYALLAVNYNFEYDYSKTTVVENITVIKQ